MSALQSNIWIRDRGGIAFRYYKFDKAWCVGRRVAMNDGWELIADCLESKSAAESLIGTACAYCGMFRTEHNASQWRSCLSDLHRVEMTAS